MTKRTLALVSLGVAASVLLSERSALSADTIWDILRRGEIPQRKIASTPVPDSMSPRIVGPVFTTAPSPGPTGITLSNSAPGAAEPAYTGPKTFWDVLRNGDLGQQGQIPSLSGGIPGQAGYVPQLRIDPATGRPIAINRGPRKRIGGMFSFIDDAGDMFRKVGKKLNSQIKISGEKSMGYHMETISGSSEAYSNDNYFGRRGMGGTYNQTELTVQGKILGVINFDTHYTDSLYQNPYENHLSVNYETKKFKFDAGDITGSITGNSLLDFNRTIKGLETTVEVLNGVRLTTLFSQPKANTRTIVIPGANTSGPYYVYAGQVVDGSEHVRVNNRDMVKGEDYMLDPYTGELRFIKPGTIIHDFETIAVTFETYGYNQDNGTLSGYRAEISRFKNLRMGFTMLEQKSPNSGGNSSEKTDQFMGYESPLSAYVLAYPVEVTITRDNQGNPISATPTHPMKAFVDSVPQTYGVDYKVDPLLPNRVFFRAAIPRTSLVKITYTPVNDNQAAGNRNVMGFDSTLQLGKIGQITAEMASSKLDLSGKGVSGTAFQLRSDMKFMKDKLAWNWNIKNIGADFTAIESPGFRRNEKGFTTGLNYSPNKDLRMVVNWESTKRPSYDYSGFLGGSSSYAAANGTDKYDSLNFQVSYQLGKMGQVSLNHNNMSTLMGAGGKTVFGTDTIQFQGKHGQFSTELSFGRNANDSVFNSSTGTGSSPTLTSFKSDALTSRASLNWTPGSKITLGATIADSQIHNDTKNTTAQDVQLNANYTPWKNLQMTLAYSLQNSGGYTPFNGTNGTNGRSAYDAFTRAGLVRIMDGTGGSGGGFGNGYGNGNGSYYGGGFNGGLGNYGNYSGGLYGGFNSFSAGSFGGNSRTTTFGINYQPFTAMNLTLNWNNSTSEGDYLFNSKRNDLNLVASYNLSDKLQLNANVASQHMAYLGSTGGGSSSLMMGFMVRANPLRRLTAMLNFSRMQTNSAQPTGSNGSNPGANPGGGGYYGFFGGATNMTTMGMRLEYPIWKGNNLFWQLDNSTGGGYGAADVKTTIVGVDFPLTDTMSFSLGWRSQHHQSKDTSLGSNFNYSVSSLDADLHLRFR